MDTVYSYDLNGCLVQQKNDKETIHYRYDGLDRLIEVTTPNHRIQYTYDSFNRRLSQTVNGELTHFVYHGQNEIGAIKNGKFTELRILGAGRGREIGAAVALELNGETFAPIHDSFGNIIALLTLSGEVVHSTRYSTFGESTPIKNGTIHNPWGYSSKRLDKETGFIYFGERYYARDLGRWMTPDPASFADGPNLYAYVHNRPLVSIDPDGQLALFLIPLGIGLAAEFLLPTAVGCLAEYAGGVAVGGLLTGLVRGYNGSFTEPCAFDGIDPTAAFLERTGMCVGTLLSVAPSNVLKNGSIKAGRVITSLATKEVSDVAKTASF